MASNSAGPRGAGKPLQTAVDPAQVGSGAAVSGKQVMMGSTRDFTSTPHSVGQTRRHLEKGDGIGEPLITEFLKKIPGINKNTVTQQLASLRR